MVSAHAGGSGVHPLKSCAATLPGYKLAFNTLGGEEARPAYLNSGDATFANIAPCDNEAHTIRGVLYLLNAADVRRVDFCERG